jgi:hypothetical protein
MNRTTMMIIVFALINTGVTIFLTDLLCFLLCGIRANGWVVLVGTYNPWGGYMKITVLGYEEPIILLFEIPLLVILIAAVNIVMAYLIRVYH